MEEEAIKAARVSLEKKKARIRMTAQQRADERTATQKEEDYKLTVEAQQTEAMLREYNAQNVVVVDLQESQGSQDVGMGEEVEGEVVESSQPARKNQSDSDSDAEGGKVVNSKRSKVVNNTGKVSSVRSSARRASEVDKLKK